MIVRIYMHFYTHDFCVMSVYMYVHIHTYVDMAFSWIHLLKFHLCWFMFLVTTTTNRGHVNVNWKSRHCWKAKEPRFGISPNSIRHWHKDGNHGGVPWNCKIIIKALYHSALSYSTNISVCSHRFYSMVNDKMFLYLNMCGCRRVHHTVQ